MSILDDIAYEKELAALRLKYYGNEEAEQPDIWEVYGDLNEDGRVEFECDVTLECVRGMAGDTQAAFIQSEMLGGLSYSFVGLIEAYIQTGWSSVDRDIDELRAFLNELNEE